MIATVQMLRIPSALQTPLDWSHGIIRLHTQLRNISLLFELQLDALVLLEQCEVLFPLVSDLFNLRVDFLVHGLVFEDVRVGHVNLAQGFLVRIPSALLIILNLTLLVVDLLKFGLQKLHFVDHRSQTLLLFESSLITAIQILNVQAQLVLFLLLFAQLHLQLLNLFI